MERPAGTIVKIATSRSQSYLYWGVYDTFRGMDSHVVHAAIELEEHGIYTIGQLVRLSEDDILKYPFMKPKIFQRMRDSLLKMDLDFGMTLPRYHDQFFRSLPTRQWDEAALPTAQVIQFPWATQTKPQPEGPAQ